MKINNIAVLGIGGLLAYTYLVKPKNNDEASYSFGAGQGGLGAGSTFTLLENSGNEVNNINAPSYVTSKKETVVNYAPVSNSLGSPATSSGGSSSFSSSSPVGLAVAQADAEGVSQKKALSATTGGTLDSGALGSYKFNAPTKSTYVPSTPSVPTPKKESKSGGLIGFIRRLF